MNTLKGDDKEERKGAAPLWFGRHSRRLALGTTALSDLAFKTSLALILGTVVVSGYRMGVDNRGAGRGGNGIGGAGAAIRAESSSLAIPTSMIKPDAVGSGALPLAASPSETVTGPETASASAVWPADSTTAGGAGKDGSEDSLAQANSQKAQGASAAPGSAAPAGSPAPASSAFGGLSALAAGLGGSGASLGAGNPNLAGGAGLAGGVGQAFDSTKLGAAKGWGGAFKPGRASTRSNKSAIRGRTRAMKQLHAAAMGSKVAQGASSSQAASTAASAPFENNPGAGSAITGSGAKTGETKPSTERVKSWGGGGGNSGPVATENAAATSAATSGSESTCYVGSTDPECAPKKAGHQDVTPWRKLVKFAAWLLLSASVLLLLGTLIPMAEGLRRVIGVVVAALGYTAALLGAAIIGAGGGYQGWMYIAGGAIVGLGGTLLAANPEAAAQSGAIFQATWTFWTGLIGGLLGATAGGVGAATKVK